MEPTLDWKLISGPEGMILNSEGILNWEGNKLDYHSYEIQLSDGIDSVMCPLDKRIEAWKRLSQALPIEKLSNIMEIKPLSQIMEHADKILSGSVRGRVVIDVNS